MEKTKELFDEWNKQKKFIEFYKKKVKNVKSWEIWICKIWINIWSEISKDIEFSRPVLVLSTHLWWDLVLIIPFTTKYNQKYSKFLIELNDFKKYWLLEKSYLVLNQFKIISLKRLDRKLNWINKNWFKFKLVDEYSLKNIKMEIFSKIIYKKEPINL